MYRTQGRWGEFKEEEERGEKIGKMQRMVYK